MFSVILDPTIELSRQFSVEIIGSATSNKFGEAVPPKLVVPHPGLHRHKIIENALEKVW
jgi:hypothetical protein